MIILNCQPQALCALYISNKLCYFYFLKMVLHHWESELMTSEETLTLTRSPLARGDTHAPSKPPTQSPTYTEMTCGSTVSGTLNEGVHFYTLRLDTFAYSVHMKSCNSEFDVYLYDQNYNEIETNVTYCASERRAFHFVDVPAGGYAVGIG
eukprot:740696_1